jgi:hypothetical protein
MGYSKNMGMSKELRVLERSHGRANETVRSVSASYANTGGFDFNYTRKSPGRYLSEQDADIAVAVTKQPGVSYRDTLNRQDTLGMLAVLHVLKFRFHMYFHADVSIEFAPTSVANTLTGDTVRLRTRTYGVDYSAPNSLVLGFPKELAESPPDVANSTAPDGSTAITITDDPRTLLPVRPKPTVTVQTVPAGHAHHARDAGLRLLR